MNSNEQALVSGTSEMTPTPSPAPVAGSAEGSERQPKSRKGQGRKPWKNNATIRRQKGSGSGGSQAGARSCVPANKQQQQQRTPAAPKPAGNASSSRSSPQASSSSSVSPSSSKGKEPESPRAASPQPESLNASLSGTETEDWTEDASSASTRSTASRGARGPPQKVRSRNGTRTAKRGAATTASINASHQKAQGILDAAKELKSQDPEARRLEKIENAIRGDTNSARRSWGLYWLKNWDGYTYWTSSHALLQLMADLRAYGLEMHFTPEKPDIVLGPCPLYMSPPAIVLPSSYPSGADLPVLDRESAPTFFYDQCVLKDTYDSLIEGRQLIYRDVEFAVFYKTEKGEALTPNDLACLELKPRFQRVELKPQWNAWAVSDERKSRFVWVDTSVRRFLRVSKTYSEIGFAATLQTLLTHRECPSHAAYFPELISDTLTWLYCLNAKSWENRVCENDRRISFDERFFDSFTGLHIMGKSFSYQTVLQIWKRRCDPYVQRLREQVVVLQSDIASWKPFTPSDSDSEDEDDPEPGAGLPTESEDEFSSDDNPNDPPMKLTRSDDNENIPLPEDSDSEDDQAETGPLVSQKQNSGVVDEDGLGLEPILPLSALCDVLFHHAFDACFDFESLLRRTTLTVVGISPFFLTNVLTRLLRRNAHFHLTACLCLNLGRPDMIYVAHATSNLWEDDLIPVSYLPVDTLPPDGSENTIYATWQELDEDGTPFPEAFESIETDEDRISLQVKDPEELWKTGTLSEVFYSVFIRRAHCYGPDYVGLAIKKRLGRSIQLPSPQEAHRFRRFIENCVLPNTPALLPRGTEDIVTRDDYLPFLINMPSASRNKHLAFLDSLNPSSPDYPIDDGAFVKMDEVLFNPKGRLIINPPPSLFYQLVSGLVDVKNTLKTQMFMVWSRSEALTIFLTYGADLTISQKGQWRARATQICGGSNSLVACLIVGGDDMGCLYGRDGVVRAWEGDVTACDQSHNEPLIHAMNMVHRKMGCSEDWCNLLEESYHRPLQARGLKVRFRRPQLHTGHPQTSEANTLTVANLACYVMNQLPSLMEATLQDGDSERLALAEGMRRLTFDLGMIWKIQVHDRVSALTFHKGFWVGGGVHGFQWLPLPSCLWKCFKMRTTTRLPQKAILERMAFSAYQRCITPQTHIVRSMAHAHFQYLMGLLGLSATSEAVEKFTQGKYKRYYDRVQRRKQLDPMCSEDILPLDHEPDWSEEQEIDFFVHRYGLQPEARLFEWKGLPTVFREGFLPTTVLRDYGSDDLRSFQDAQASAECS